MRSPSQCIPIGSTGHHFVPPITKDKIKDLVEAVSPVIFPVIKKSTEDQIVYMLLSSFSSNGFSIP